MSKLKPEIVEEIISRFERSKNLDLEILKADARILVSQSYWYADALGTLGKAYRSSRVSRKEIYATTKAVFISSGDSGVSSEAKTLNDPIYKEAYAKEYEYEGSYERGKRLLNAIGKVIDRMNQEIADLRKEKEYQRHTPT